MIEIEMNTLKLVKGWNEMGSNVQMLSSSPDNFLEQYFPKNEPTNDRELKESPVELISSIRMKKGEISIFSFNHHYHSRKFLSYFE